MAVDVYPLNILSMGGGGQAPITSFSDNFLRGQLNPPSVPLNWAYGIIPNDTWVPPNIYSVVSLDGTGNMNFSPIGTNNPTQTIANYVECIALRAIWGKTQFAQSTFKGQTSGGTWFDSLCVCIDYNNNAVSASSICQFCAYAAMIQTGGTILQLMKLVRNGANNGLGGNVSMTQFGANQAVAANDVIRISALVGAGQTTVTLSKNGTQLLQQVDNTLPLQTGIPGYTMVANSITGGVPGSSAWAAFSAGLGV